MSYTSIDLLTDLHTSESIYSHTHTKHTLIHIHVSYKFIIFEGFNDVKNRRKFTRTRCMTLQYISKKKLLPMPQIYASGGRA